LPWAGPSPDGDGFQPFGLKRRLSGFVLAHGAEVRRRKSRKRITWLIGLRGCDRMKVICVVGAQPNFMKAAPLMEAFVACGVIEPFPDHTGQPSASADLRLGGVCRDTPKQKDAWVWHEQ